MPCNLVCHAISCDVWCDVSRGAVCHSMWCHATWRGPLEHAVSRGWCDRDVSRYVCRVMRRGPDVCYVISAAWRVALRVTWCELVVICVAWCLPRRVMSRDVSRRDVRHEACHVMWCITWCGVAAMWVMICTTYLAWSHHDDAPSYGTPLRMTSLSRGT
jgi:hypothetical protein